MHRPVHTLLFGISVFAALALLTTVFPEKGLEIGGMRLRFASWSGLWPDETPNTAAIRSIRALDRLDSAVSVPEAEAAASQKDSTLLNTGIQMPEPTALDRFFEALRHPDTHNGPVHVLHYGDSQIEGDRITDFLRMKLQGRFGGNGPGLVSFIPVSPTMVNRITVAGEWERYNSFNAKDPRIAHNNYGVMASYSRYLPLLRTGDTTRPVTATATIVTTKFGGPAAMQYTRLRLLYGGAKRRTWCEVYDGPVLAGADSLEAGGNVNVFDVNVTRGSNSHVFRFTGTDSPDLYGVSLEGEKGIVVDNIPMRGSSGTFFHLINAAQLKTYYRLMNARLIILQFGGNAMPAIRDATGAKNYGSYIRYQLTVLKKLAPGAAILFIGPSDMSVKDGMNYVTVPFLEETRDAIRATVLEQGAAFFDMYSCMGGRNSMPVWVGQKLAASDYTHFSPQGARKIAIMLYAALDAEYNKYLQRKK